MKRGDVIFWPHFLFPDGTASPKLLVVLGEDKNDCLLMLRTTSQERSYRPDGHGCHANHSVFRFKNPLCGFEKGTWVQFEQPIIKERREVVNASGHVKFALAPEDVAAIINCYKRSPEIATWLAEYCR